MPTSTFEMEPTEVDAGLSRNNSHFQNHEDEESITSTISICPLCDEDLTSMAALTVILSTCQHQSCGTCLIRWIDREELSGRRDMGPTCPFCRVTISECDVLRLMGRPFFPRMEEAAVGDEIDEFTLHWINQNTTPCPFCGIRVEKSGGDDRVECLCGRQFCYSCGGAYGRCECNPNWMRGWEVRKERSSRYEEERAHWEYARENPSLCTFNGRWMFSSQTSSRCIAMLMQQLGHEIYDRI